MSESFPFDHFTLRETDQLEYWRRYASDRLIAVTPNVIPGRTQEEIRSYLLRNPRKPREAA